jgi:nicotinate-nucleotide pyrophosphorylase (carboxylating)
MVSPPDFSPVLWDSRTQSDCRQLIELAVQEDLQGQHDWTTLATVSPGLQGTAAFVPREAGIVAGLPAISLACELLPGDLQLEPQTTDTTPCQPGETIALVSGNIRDMLTAERLLLNLLGRMMGIATLASSMVELTTGTKAQIYDTRKTTPGWRRLEKYAVRCGGAHNHRTGLFDAILIKDNHLAQLAQDPSVSVLTDSAPDLAAMAVRRAQDFLQESGSAVSAPRPAHPEQLVIEIEVDTLDQFEAVLPVNPHLVLLDNMTCDQLRRAVAIRDQRAPQVKLEASGGISAENLREIASTGVDRISMGSLTHTPRWLDVGLDWRNR